MKQPPSQYLLRLADRAADGLHVLLGITALLGLGLLAARWFGFVAAPWLDSLAPAGLALLCAVGWWQSARRARAHPFTSLLLDQIHEGLIATGLDLRIVYWGKGAERLYGYSAQEVLGCKIDELLHMSGGEEAEARALEALKQGGWTATYQTWRQDGSTFWVETHVSPAQDDRGRPVGYIGIHRDVTDHQQAELALEESETRLRLMMESVHLATVATDREGCITFCNDCLAQLSGWSKEELIGSQWVERFMPVEERASRVDAFKNMLVGEESANHWERVILTKTGGRLIIAWNVITLRDPAGKPSGIAAIGEDITERRRIEQDEARRMAELDALRQAGRFITSAWDHTSALFGIVSAARLLLGSEVAMILLHDPQKKDLEIAAFDGSEDLLRQFMGGIDQPLVGQHIPDGYGVAGWVLRQREPVLVANLQQIKGRENMNYPPHSFIAVPMIFQGQAIGVMEVDHATIGAFNEHHQTVLSMMADFAAMAVIHDRLLEAERLQHRLADQSQAQLVQSEKLNAMGRLVAFLAHEINNPLQSLSSGLNLMREVPLSESEQHEYLDVACREVERLSKIVERVLGFTRRPGDGPMPADLHQLLDETLALIHKRLEQGRVRMDCHFAPDLPPVVGFGGQLQQVFLNLMLNALEAMPDGGTLTITTRYEPLNEQVRLQFRDSGVGIAPEVLPHLFEPFYTTRSEGNGLGLPICYSIIEKHQGRIEIESEPGQGSCFTVVLPSYSQPVTLAVPGTHPAVSDTETERKFDGRTKRKYPGG